MRTESTFSPTWAVPPGRTLSDLLAAKNVSCDQLASSIELSRDDLDDLLKGTALLTERVACRLEGVFGTSASFWMRREKQYREQLASWRAGVDITDTRYKQWLKDLPLADMVRFGWLDTAGSATDKLTKCLSFFDVPNLDVWNRNYDDVKQAVAFRASAAHTVSMSATAAWVRQGERESTRIDCAPWNPDVFSAKLSAIRSLTRTKDPEIFIKELQTQCAAAGVAVVIVRAPSGCRASGATFFSSPVKAVLLLSFRYLTDDQFWFSFFHEAGHLLLHRNADSLILETLDDSDSQQEIEANEFAASTLLPSQFEMRLPEVANDTRAIMRLARDAGIAPGIVVGQLQHRGLLKQHYFNKLKVRYNW